mgnify:CR=1 FL=1
MSGGLAPFVKTRVKSRQPATLTWTVYVAERASNLMEITSWPATRRSALATFLLKHGTLPSYEDTSFWQRKSHAHNCHALLAHLSRIARSHLATLLLGTGGGMKPAPSWCGAECANVCNRHIKPPRSACFAASSLLWFSVRSSCSAMRPLS